MQTDSQLVLFIAAGLVGFVALLAVATSFKHSRFVVLVMMFMAGIAAPVDHTGLFLVQTWLLPLQTYRSAMYLGCGFLLLIAGLVHFRRCSMKWVGGQAWVLLAISFYSALLWMVHEPFIEGLQTFVFLAATVTPLAFVVPALLQKHRDWDKLIGIIIAVNVLSVAAVIVQFVVDRNLLMVGLDRRFTGMLGNPQHAAVFYAICCVVVLSVMLNTTRYRYWWFLACLLGINVILLGWTGSRTGALMLMVGVTAVLYRRAGRGILLLPLGALTIWLGYLFAGWLGIDLGLERLVSTVDTRTAAWVIVWHQGLDNFLIGVGISERLVSESSFLTAFAAFGIGMLMLVILLVFVAIVQCWRLFHIGRALPQWGRQTDLLIAFNLMFFAGSIFEGYIISRINFSFLLLLIFSGMGGKIIHLYRTGELIEIDDAQPETYEESPLLYDEALEPQPG